MMRLSPWRVAVLGALLLAASAVLAPVPAQAQQTDKQRAEEVKKILAEIDKLRARVKELEAPAKTEPAKTAPAKTASKTSGVGSIKVEGKLKKEERAKLARVSRADAEKAALAAVKSKDAVLEDAGLKIKDGYLVWIVDVKVGKNDLEVIVDAGTGKVLAIVGQEGQTAAPAKEAAKPTAKPVVIEIDLAKLPPDLQKELLKYIGKGK